MADVLLLNKVKVSGDYDNIPMALETELTTRMVNITLAKTADKLVWAQGELTYTITVTNNADEPLNDAVMVDTIENSKVTFIEGSVTVNSAAAVYTYAAGVLTVELPDIATGGTAVITFRVSKA